MKKINIGCVIPIPDDPTSWYRGLGPIVRLCKTYENISYSLLQGPVNWATLLPFDLIFFQRPAAPEHLQVLIQAKELGIPVWVDFDDDNLAVPKDNPTYPVYSQMVIKETIVKLARSADLLTVTTEFLKRKYGVYNKNTVIIPNALDDKILHLRRVQKPPREDKIVWRGTQSHIRNLMSVGLNLISLSQKWPAWKFTFFGYDPYELTDRIRNHEFIPAMPITNFYSTLCNIHGSVLYYPVIETDHGQARSHISWLEGTFGNMAVVAYKNAEFTRPGILNFTSPTEFEHVIERFINREIDIDKTVEESWQEIQSKYLLSITNKKRLEHIEALLK